MEYIKGSLLEAIQNLPGDTIGEKYKSVNQIATKIAKGTISRETVAEPLQPFVDVALAKILKQPELITNALKTEDTLVIERALTFPNLFCDHSPFLQFQYVYEILGNASLKTRTNIIKKIARDLVAKNHVIAEEFYTKISEIYGLNTALPLLAACSGDFIGQQVDRHNILLPKAIVEKLYLYQPNFVIEYFKFCLQNENFRRRRIRFDSLCEVLPRLIKNYFQQYVELCVLFHEKCYIKPLSNKKAQMFLKQGINALKQNPETFFKILPLKLVSARLNTEDFQAVISVHFPKNLNYFNADNILHYFDYYPVSQRVSLIASIFRKVYGVDLYSCPDKITSSLLILLPPDERIKQARIKLQKDTDLHLDNYTESWRCYLLPNEVIPQIKAEIANSSTVEKREKLLNQMIFVCKVNDDKTALKEVLEYFVTRHKNEQATLISETLNKLMMHFKLYTLDEIHWNILNEVIKRAKVTNLLFTSSFMSCKLLEEAIHYNLDHNLPIEEYMMLLIKIRLSTCMSQWNILQEYPDYERRCLETVFNLIGTVFPDDHSIWAKNRQNKLQNLMESIYSFNDRNKKNKNVDPLDIKSFPWLMTHLELSLKTDKWMRHTKYLLKQREPILYEKWVKDNVEDIEIGSTDILHVLKKDYTIISKSWEKYLQEVLGYTHVNVVRRFLKIVRWYKHIPIKFACRSVEMLITKKERGTGTVLAHLFNGPVFERIIDPLIPFEPKLDVNVDDECASYRLIETCLEGVIVCSPPVSFTILRRLCSSDYLSLLVKCLKSVARRSSTAKVMHFAESLLDQRVSVRKHGVRLVCMVASLNDKCDFLKHYWEVDTHRSIRGIMLKEAWNTFVADPSDTTWNLMQFCLQNQTVDDEEIVRLLSDIKVISTKYVVEYAKLLLNNFESLNSVNPTMSKMLIKELLTSSREVVDEVFPEEFLNQLIKRYVFDAVMDSGIVNLGSQFALNTYLRGKNVESRLTFFTEHLINFMKSNIDKCDPMKCTYYPANQLMHDLVENCVYIMPNSAVGFRVMKALKQCFEVVMKPFQDPESFLILMWMEKAQEIQTAKEFGTAIGFNLDFIVQLFNKEFIMVAAQILNNQLWYIKEMFKNEENFHYDVIQGLLEVNSPLASIVAAELCSDIRSEQILLKLKQCNNLTVTALLYKNIILKDKWN